MPASVCPDVSEALALLGKRQVVLVVHDTSFPAAPGEDLGHGSPYASEGRAFVAYARSLGCNGLQLGPQGRTRPGNDSPYCSSLFARNELAISLGGIGGELALAELLSPDTLARLRDAAHVHARRTDHAAARGAWQQVIAEALPRLRGREELRRRVAAFAAAQRSWLMADAADEAGSAQRGETRRERRQRFALTQFVVHRQHAAWRAWLRDLGMTLWGDLQVGMSPHDERRFRRLFLPGYRLGAPPSRTNPRGQPWDYPVFDPRRFDARGTPETSVLTFLRQRIAKMIAEYDGLRVDHPHGLICPWVYRSDQPDAYAAVQHGARLFESPALPDHPALARFARVRADQLNPDDGVPRHADDWVVDLREDQVDAYAVLFDVLVETTPKRPDGGRGLMCEVLSTQPHPMRRVLARYGLGRYRVTQKADPGDPRDVYRSENAQPQDWVMVGNHDTPPIWSLARDWLGTERGAAEAEALARRLSPGEDHRPLLRVLASDAGALVHAKFADVFASPAEHVKVFFTDLLGMTETYNQPGTVGPHNWTLRVPPDWRAHGARAASKTALDLRVVLGLALRARGLSRSHAALIARLQGAPAG